ncbi:DUF456 domain-containing protein [Propionibacteriaceae bacterium Y1923]|uniref:DUF456 domain-containing protein n=1 Tax=Aestuariimicrobium sp. Y1814 TaxID=3418742 RepID=UPI003C159F1C
MTPLLAGLLAFVLALIGVVGIIVPVLPGSITILAGLLVWGIWGGSTQAVVFAIIGGALVLAGMTASAVLTKRNLDKKQIPQWPVIVALIGGVVGSFVLPGFGLLVGFVVTLLVCELVRVRDLKQGLSTSWTALKSVGLGMLIELALALLAVTGLGISVFMTLI